MTIPDTQQWLSPAQVADAFGKKVDWVYDQIKIGKSNRAGTNGIPARMVRKVGGSIHIHRSFVFTEERAPSNVELSNLQVLPPPPYAHLSERQIIDLGVRVLVEIMDEFSATLEKYRGQSSAPIPQVKDRAAS